MHNPHDEFRFWRLRAALLHRLYPDLAELHLALYTSSGWHKVPLAPPLDQPPDVGVRPNTAQWHGVGQTCRAQYAGRNGTFVHGFRTALTRPPSAVVEEPAPQQQDPRALRGGEGSGALMGRPNAVR